MRTVVAVRRLAWPCVHAGLWALLRDQQYRSRISADTLASVSYAPFEGTGTSRRRRPPDAASRSAPTCASSAPLTRAIRTYSSTGGVELVPPIAAEFGLQGHGRRLDRQGHRAQRARNAARSIELAKRNSNVNGIVVGNETIYRGELKVDDLIKLIQRVKRQVDVPVTTGEIWNVWIEHPELVSAVDFIAAHILPYWEGFSGNAGRRSGDHHLRPAARAPIPGKRIVIAEFGWPSAGYNLKAANPGPHRAGRACCATSSSRAEAYRHRLQHRRSDRSAVEDLRRRRRPLLGHLRRRRASRNSPGPARSTNPDHWKLAGIALLVGVLLSLPILR